MIPITAEHPKAGFRCLTGAVLFSTLAIVAGESGNPQTELPKPFTSGERYLEKYETGLYPEGKNEMPAVHRKAGEDVATSIRPLDVEGRPDEEKGKIVAMALGHSNCKAYFGAFQEYLRAHAEEVNPKFEVINGGLGSRILQNIAGYARQTEKGLADIWLEADKKLGDAGCSANQVQILFLHTTYHQAGPSPSDSKNPFPERMQRMQKDLATVLEFSIKVYPNLRIAYLTSDGLRVFAKLEPQVWEEAFAFKWMIENQIKGEVGTEFLDKDGQVRRLPWICWGPYIWDPTWDKTYFRDGVHPSEKGKEAFVKKYWDLLRSDSVARTWLFKDQKSEVGKPDR